MVPLAAHGHPPARSGIGGKQSTTIWHDEKDVIAGALLGIASSMWLVERLPRVNVALSLDRQIGVRISGHF